MNKKFDILLVTILAVLATWIIFAAMPYFRLRGGYPQVDTQILFLHGLCSILYLYQAIKVTVNKDEISKHISDANSTEYTTESDF